MHDHNHTEHPRQSGDELRSEGEELRSEEEFLQRQRRAFAQLRLQDERVSRNALVGRLDRFAPLTQVSGAAGAGRTTLLADWAYGHMTSGEVVLWVDIHPGLSDLPAVREHLAALVWGEDWSVGSAGSGAGGGAGDGVGGSRAGGIPAGRDPVAWVCNRYPDARVLLILDQAEPLTDPEVWAWLTDLSRTQPTLHIVGASDHPAPLHADLLATQLPLVRITGADLMVSASEAAEFVRGWGYVSDQDAVSELVDATGGWLGLMRAVLDCGTALPDSGARHFRATVPPGSRTETLLAVAGIVSVLGRVTAELLDHVLQAMQVLLRTIGAEGITTADLLDSGMLRMAEDGETLLVPAVLESLLAQELLTAHPEAEVALHAEAAVHCEATGRPEDLIYSALHARRAEDWERLNRLASVNGWWFGARFGSQALDAYGSIPDAVVQHYPILNLTRTLTHALPAATIEPDVRSPVVQRVFATIGETLVRGAIGITEPNAKAFLGAAAINALRQRGDSEGALRASEELRHALIPRWEEASALNRAMFYLQSGLAAVESGDFPRAVRKFTRAYEESSGVPSQFVAASAVAHNALLLAYEGRHEASQHWVYRATEGVRGQPWIEAIVRTPVLVARAHLALDLADDEAARELLAAADPLTAVNEVWPLLVDAHVRMALADGTAVETLDRIEHTAQTRAAARPTSPLADILVTRARCALLLSEGELNRAKRLIDDALRPGLENVPVVGRGALSVPLARLRRMAGKHREARQAVSAAVAHGPTRRQSIDLLVIDAASALALGDEADVTHRIGRIIAMTGKDGLTSALRALDLPTRLELLERITGARKAVLPPSDAPLFTYEGLFPASGSLIELTEREQSVLQGLAEGLSLAELASRDVLSVNTVKKQTVSLYRKVGADNRADAQRIAYEQGLLG